MKQQGKKLTEKEKVAWAYQFETAKRWLNAVLADRTGSVLTELSYAKALYDFCEWCGKNPDQLISERREQLKNPETENIAEDVLRRFCLEQEARGLKRSTVANRYHATIRSFYKYNGVPLRLPYPRFLKTPFPPHTIEEVKALIEIANVRERAIIMFLKDSGMSRSDFCKLKYKHVRKELEKGENFIHIRATRQKEAIAYDTFIGKNAVEALKTYLEYRKRKGETIHDNSPLFATVSGKPLRPYTLSTLFIRLSEKVGFKTSPHKFRKFFESHMGLKAPSMLVKYWMGHSLGVERSYFIPPVEKQREAYINAYEAIDLFKPEMSETELRKRQIMDNLKLMGVDEHKIKVIEELLKGLVTSEQIEQFIDTELKRILEEKEQEDCQKIVTEHELEKWLKQGWHIEAVLPSGKIVISNE